MKDLELIGIEEIMRMTGKGRATVTRWLNDPECPTCPRHKHEPYMVERNDFITWYSSQCMKRKRVKA